MRILFIVALLFVALMLVIPADASEPEDKGDDFSHAVVLELFVTTWCEYCPDGEAMATQLNYEYRDNFFFMSMVTDENEKANDRSDRYNVVSVPTAIFDGDYREDRSGNADSYEGHIDDCGGRDVPDIELEVTLEPEGNGTVRVGYRIVYNDAFPPWRDVNLKVAIVEKVSRYTNNRNESIPYGFIDYAFDKDITLVSQTEQSESTTWDATGTDFQNLVAIGAVFDDATTGFALQAASTETYANIMIGNVTWEPENPDADEKIVVSVEVSGDVDHVILEAAACTEDSCLVPEELNMTHEGGDLWTTTIGPYKEGYEVHLKIVAEDTEGGKMVSPQFAFTVGEGKDSSEDDSLPGFSPLFMVVSLIGALLIAGRRQRH